MNFADLKVQSMWTKKVNWSTSLKRIKTGMSTKEDQEDQHLYCTRKTMGS